MRLGAAREGEEASVQAAFFIMPIQILKSLHDEFRHLAGADAARAILFRIGYSSGEAVTRKINIRMNSGLTLPETLTSLWIEMGLGRIIVSEEGEGRLHVQCDGSSEAQALGRMDAPSCDLTCGYLAGTASALSRYRYHCVETECVTNGSELCLFDLVPRHEA